MPIKLDIEKTWCRQKRNKLEQFLQISVHIDLKSTKKPYFNQNSKINPIVLKSILESNCKRFSKSAIRKNFNLKPDPQMKKLNPKKLREYEISK